MRTPPVTVFAMIGAATLLLSTACGDSRDRDPVLPPPCSIPTATILDGSAREDLALAYDPPLLGDGFELLSAERPNDGSGCDGTAYGEAQITAVWRHLDTGEALTVVRSYREGDVNFIWPGSFQVYAAGGLVTVAGEGFLWRDGADAEPGIAIRAALEEARTQLAPGIERRCYWTTRPGVWDDIGELGMRDPRSALHAGLQQEQLSIALMVAPPTECEAGSPPKQLSTLSARWGNGAGGSLQITAVALPTGGEPRADNYSPEALHWRGERVEVDVTWTGIPEESAVAIARAIEPAFATLCFVRTRLMTPGEFAALSLRTPAPPSGHAILPDELDGGPAGAGKWVTERLGACEAEPPGGFTIRWLMVAEGQAGFIEAGVDEGVQLGRLAQFSHVRGQTLFWRNEDGRSYHVTGVKARFDRAMLLAVAGSLDAEFSEERLLEPAWGAAEPP